MESSEKSQRTAEGVTEIAKQRAEWADRVYFNEQTKDEAMAFIAGEDEILEEIDKATGYAEVYPVYKEAQERRKEPRKLIQGAVAKLRGKLMSWVHDGHEVEGVSVRKLDPEIVVANAEEVPESFMMKVPDMDKIKRILGADPDVKIPGVVCKSRWAPVIKKKEVVG